MQKTLTFAIKRTDLVFSFFLTKKVGSFYIPKGIFQVVKVSGNMAGVVPWEKEIWLRFLLASEYFLCLIFLLTYEVFQGKKKKNNIDYLMAQDIRQIGLVLYLLKREMLTSG